MQELIQKISFPVRESKVYDEYGVIPDYKAIIREDTKKTLAIVSKQYKLIPHTQLIPFINFCENNGWQVQDFKLHNHGARLKVVLVKNTELFDRCLPALYLKNSLDCSLRLHIETGIFRTICSNGLLVPAKFFKMYHFRIFRKHIGRFHLNTDLLIKTLKQIENIYTSKIPDFLKKMNETEIKEELAKEILKREITKKYYQEILFSIYKNFLKLTLWSLYNEGVRFIQSRKSSFVYQDNKIQKFSRVIFSLIEKKEV